jgi:hypothetical protein
MLAMIAAMGLSTAAVESTVTTGHLWSRCRVIVRPIVIERDQGRAFLPVA